MMRDEARTWMQEAEKLLRMRRTEKAVQSFRYAALYFVKQGLTRKALAVHERVLALAPEDIDAALGAARAYAELGLVPEAIARYQRAIRGLADRGRSEKMYEIMTECSELAKSRGQIVAAM
jgi:tetratricopeptide (TPR) repeat protein